MSTSPWLVDGRYRNLDPFEIRGWREVRRWRRDRAASGWKPTGAPAPVVAPDLARLRAPPGPQATWIGHATYLVQVDGVNVLTDPVWGHAGLSWLKRAGVPREVPPGVPWEAMPRVDLVVVSHNHFDHLEGLTFARLPRGTPVLCPEGLGGWFRRRGYRDAREVPWWETTKAAGLDVTAVPAQHWSRRGLNDVAKSHWCGWAFGSERRVYFAGDSGWFRGFSLIGERAPADVAILPVGAYEPRWFMKDVHMNPEEAVEAYVAVRARRLLPMHWGTFRLTDEPLDEPPRRLRAAWEARAPGGSLAIPAVGETVAL